MERDGYCPSERIVGEALRNILRDAEGRVIVTTFASNIGRLQQVIDQSVAAGRVVAITGRSMERIFATAQRLGYLQVPPQACINLTEIANLPPERITIITTGSQGEPLAALSRMARGSHRHVRITEGDTVIMSASPIPGNESLIWRTINRLFGQGARVIYGPDQGVHVSGHGYREELKLMLSLTHPRFVIPSHGDQRHLVLYRDLAMEMGWLPEHIFQLYPGACVEMRNQKAYRGPNVPGGAINVDGLGVGDVGDIVLSDRTVLAAEGIFMPVLVVQRDTCELLTAPEIYSRGFIYMDESEELLELVKEQLVTIVEEFVTDGAEGGPEELYSRIKSQTSRRLFEITGRRPIVLPAIMPLGEADDDQPGEVTDTREIPDQYLDDDDDD